MKYISRLSLALMLSLGACGVCAQQASDPAAIFSDPQALIKKNCEAVRLDFERSKSLGKVAMEGAEESVDAACSCMPKEADRVRAALNAAKGYEAKFMEYTRLVQACSNGVKRSRLIAACPADRGVIARAANIQTYCACVNSKIAGMSDEQLVNENLAAMREVMIRASKNEMTEDDKMLSGSLYSIPLRHLGAGCPNR